MTALFGPRTAEPSRARRMAFGSRRGIERIFGVEHEFGVFREGVQIDFRELIHELAIDGRAVHPTNSFHYLTRDGPALIADGRVAEIATPPIDMTLGFAHEGAAWAERARHDLDALLPDGHRLVGGSTHLNFSVDPARNDRLALLFARRFSAALMLLMDQDVSPGLLVRPRPGRLELCGEYVRGDSLAAATVFASGAIAALDAHLGDRYQRLPELLDIAIEPGRRRYGWYVDRASFGTDLYAAGRSADLTLVRGGATTAGAFLAQAWDIARPHAARTATPAELDLVDRRVAGADPLPLESGETGRVGEQRAPSRHPAGLAVQTIASANVTLSPRCATWDWAAWQATTETGSVVVQVPRTEFADFATHVEQGGIDRAVFDAVARRADLSALTHVTQMGGVAFFSDVESGAGLLPNDRYGIGDAPASSSRPGKRDLSDEAEPRTRARSGTGAAVLLVFAVLVATALRLGGPASAGGGEVQDPRSLFGPPEVIIPGDDGVAWFVLEPQQPWGVSPPADVFSLFFDLTFTINGVPGTMGWQTHDGVQTPLSAMPLLLIDDGRIAGSTGISVNGSFVVDGTVNTGSWRDETTTTAIFRDQTFSLNETDVLPPDALDENFAVYDLVAGEPIEPPPPPLDWQGLRTIVGDGMPLIFGGDGMIDDPPGDLQDYYGSFDSSRADVGHADWVSVDFGPEFPPDVRRDTLDMMCAQGFGPGAAPICPFDTETLANAGSWLYADLFFTGGEQVIQAGLSWADPGRPVYDGPVSDPNTGRNTSLEVFSGELGFDLGTTMFDGAFSSTETDDVLAVLRLDGVSLIFNGDVVSGITMPQLFTVTPGGVDLVTLPETPAGSITVGQETEDSVDPPVVPDDGDGVVDDPGDSGEITDGDSGTETGSGSETDPGTETDSGTETDPGTGGGSSNVPWLLILTGLVTFGAGALIVRSDRGTTDTTSTIVTGFEKGTASAGSAISMG